ncbi:MAG: hypothetical protein K6F09_02740 [Clostridiales bacterium]|nr:hypothetical protein [Clostridiales bacterium]
MDFDLGKMIDNIKDIDWGKTADKIKPIFTKILGFLKQFPKYFTAAVLFFTIIFDTGAGNTSTSTLISEKKLFFTEAAYAGQGLTTDGKIFYTSGSMTGVGFTALAKFDPETKKSIKRVTNPLPKELKKRGNNHIGGISYYDGKIYAAVEDDERMYPCIVVFSADTLSYVTHYDLPTSWFPSGVPWVAVNGKTGQLFTATWDKATSIYQFDIDSTMAPVKEIPVLGVDDLERVQDGEFYDGTLYLSSDTRTDGATRNVYAVNTISGRTRVAFTRNVGKDYIETEGFTAFHASDGSVFHAIDYNSKLLSVYFRSYTVELE